MPEQQIVGAAKARSSVTGAAARPAAARNPRPGLVVEAEQRRRLIECCAYFKASRYRPVRPGQVRGKDLQQAETEIDTVLGKRGPR